MKKILYILLTGLFFACTSDKNGGETNVTIPIDPGIYDIENLNSKPVVMGDHASESAIIPMDLTKIETPIGNVPTLPVHTGIEFGVYLEKTAEKTTVLTANIDKSTFQLLSFLQLYQEKKIILNLYSPIASRINMNLVNSLGESVEAFQKIFKIGRNELTLDIASLADGNYELRFDKQAFRINFPLKSSKY